MNKKIDRCIEGLTCHKWDYYKKMLKRYERTKKCSVCGKRIINMCWIPNYKEKKHVVCTKCVESEDINIQSKVGEYKDSKILYILGSLSEVKKTFSKRISVGDTKGIRLLLKCEKFGLDEFTEVLITDLQVIFIDENIAETYYSKDNNWIYCCKYIDGEYVMFYIRIEALGYNLNILKETKSCINFKPREFTLRKIDLDDNKNILIKLEVDEYRLELTGSKAEEYIE
ncbi:hypothetical protein [uncultured Clostridium sp.]|uniref:hypothetical protein n=1 Tax=uncultured Clostridium sp. TaxID=59620 RepID=UPI002637BA0E|nr:hypothetical protein [uncultured Clostridium sp.]